MLISVGCFAGVNLMIKFLTNIPATELVLFRSIITLAISYVLLRRRKINPWGNDKKWLLIRGIAGTTALTIFFYTIQKMPLSAAVTIQYLSPFFTAFIAGFLLGRKLDGHNGDSLSFPSLVIVKGQVPNSTDLLLLGVVSSVFSAAYNAIRKLKMSPHLSSSCTFLLWPSKMIGFSFFNWITPVGMEWLLLIAVGILTQFAQVYMTKPTSSEINTVAPLKYIGVIFALTWDILLFDFVPNGTMFLGIAMVVGGVVLNLQYKARLAK